MKPRDIDRRLQEADPASSSQMASLDLGPAEAALAEKIVAEPGSEGASEGLAMSWPSAGSRRRRSLVGLAGTIAAGAAAIAVLLSFGSGTSESPSRAYGAKLVRFAEATPLLLLEGPGWRVQDVYEAAHGPNSPKSSSGEGTMEFVTGNPLPDESIRVAGRSRSVCDPKARYRESGMLPAAVRQRKVELRWSHGSLEEALKTARCQPHPHGQRWTTLPVLGTTADVDTRAEFYANQGAPGNRRMTAFWSEGGYLLELKAAVPDLAAFKERLSWLSRVDLQTWLDAMPATVVKAADHDAVVRQMLKGVPVPNDFKSSMIPDEGLTTSRLQVRGAVTNTVSCLWFRQWGAARRSGDNDAKVEAERAMATFRRWPILREEAREEGGYPETLVKLVASMPSGVWQYGPHRWRLLPKAEGLGCARLGLPLLPRKQKLQRERGVPQPR
jgi:hypothetical protein